MSEGGDKKKKAPIMTTIDHRKAIVEGVQIMVVVNDLLAMEKAPFHILGDPESEVVKSF